MRFFEKHNYESVEFLGNFFYKFEVLNEKNSFHYDKIVSTVFIAARIFTAASLGKCCYQGARTYGDLN